MAHQQTNMTPAPPDMAEMAELYQQYAPAIFSYLIRQVPDEEDAEDLLVEVFLAARSSSMAFCAISPQMRRITRWPY